MAAWAHVNVAEPEPTDRPASTSTIHVPTTAQGSNRHSKIGHIKTPPFNLLSPSTRPLSSFPSPACPGPHFLISSPALSPSSSFIYFSSFFFSSSPFPPSSFSFCPFSTLCFSLSLGLVFILFFYSSGHHSSPLLLLYHPPFLPLSLFLRRLFVLLFSYFFFFLSFPCNLSVASFYSFILPLLCLLFIRFLSLLSVIHSGYFYSASSRPLLFVWQGGRGEKM